MTAPVCPHIPADHKPLGYWLHVCDPYLNDADDADLGAAVREGWGA